MTSLYDKLTENIVRWAQRGSGTATYPAPVLPAPAFVPFPGHRLPAPIAVDDGRRPNFFSRLTQGVKQTLQPVPAIKKQEPKREPEPNWFGEKESPQVEFRILLPQDFTATPEAMAQFLAGVSLASCPLTLELIGAGGMAALQLAVEEEDAQTAVSQLGAHFPQAMVSTASGTLEQAWGDSEDGMERAVIELALSSLFMFPLASPGKADLFAGMAGAMSALGGNEAAIYQVTFMPLTDAWATNALSSVLREDGRPYFDDGAELAKAAREKVSCPLYAAVVRLAAKASELDRVWQILRLIAAPLRLFSRPGGNELIPLRNDDYPVEEHSRDVLTRRCRRSGMVLNLDELTSFLRFPTAAVSSPPLLRLGQRTRSSPPRTGPGGVCIGVNEHAGTRADVWLGAEQRVRHTHIIGASGSGKTTLIRYMIQQDMDSGAGFCVLDPHGDLIDSVMSAVPRSRIQDVVLIDPSDTAFSVGCNVLCSGSEFERTLLASDLVGVFRRLSTSWGDQMNSVLGNAIHAFLEHKEGGTLVDLRRFLLDPPFRKCFLEGVTDPEILYYWTRTFPHLGGNRSLGPILTRLENFLSPKSIRCMVGQQDRNLDIGGIMDSGKILLIKLSEGLIGAENSHLLGSLLVMRLQMMAMSRQRMDSAQRRPFWLYIDEFQNFITPSLAEMLSGGRKYGLGLVLAHQQLRHLRRDEEVEAAVFANTFTRIIFRCSDDDSRQLEKGLSHFTAKDIQNLGIGEAIVRLERSDQDFNLQVPLPAEPDTGLAATRRSEAIASSRELYGRPRADVERELAEKLAGSLKTESKSAPTRSQAPASQLVAPPAPAPELPVALSAEARPAAVLPEAEPEDRRELEVPPRKPGEGVGGPAHRIVVQQLAQEADALGFWSDREFTLPGRERVDLAIGIGSRKIAVEVAMTTNTRHEIENLTKCLAGEFSQIVSVSPHAHIIGSIQAAVRRLLAEGGFTDAQFARLRFLSPTEFVEFLKSVAGEEAQQPEKEKAPDFKVIGGRRVAIRRAERTPEQRKIEDEGLRAVAEIISRSRPGSPPS